MIVIDIAVPRDADPVINDLEGVYLYDIDALDKVVQANLAERLKAAEHATRIVEHEANQFEQWMRTQGVVPTIRALREHFAHVADAEVQKALDQLGKKELSRDQQRELLQRTVQLVVNKLLHTPTTALRGAAADEATVRAAIVCELFGLSPSDAPEAVADAPETEQAAERKAQA
jgi:glutamyl-tRNA reductase